MSLRLKTLAATLACGAAITLAAPVALPSMGTFSAVTAARAQEPAQFQAILARYGTFQAHARYGEVWVPSTSTVPLGWHPYMPCNFVYTKDLGWYYDDRSEWGRIVHHYGRWAHDANLGWVWVKGEEFSPAWVVFRTSDSYVGWAPMPPEQDLREISATQFNTDKHWTFMDAKKFGTRCGDGISVASPAIYPTIFQSTHLVTEIRFVRGIAVFVLPPPLIINIVDIDINIFAPWTPCFFGAWFWNWNFMMTNIVINVNLPAGGPQCPPQLLQQKVIPIISNPPPAPGGKGHFQPPQTIPDRRTELEPRNPGQQLGPKYPPVVQDPPRVFNPGFVRPNNPGQPPRQIGNLPKLPDPQINIRVPDRTPPRPIGQSGLGQGSGNQGGNVPGANGNGSRGNPGSLGNANNGSGRVMVPRLTRTPEQVVRSAGSQVSNSATHVQRSVGQAMQGGSRLKLH